MTDVKVDSEYLLHNYDDNEAGLLGQINKLNHHESTNKNEEGDSEFSLMMETCDITTAVPVEDSSKEYISDEVQRLIQNRMAMNVFYAGALFSFITCCGMSFMHVFMIRMIAKFLGSIMMFSVQVWITVSLLLSTYTLILYLSTLWVGETLILDIFLASYESRFIGNESMTDSRVSFIDSKIQSGIALGIILSIPINIVIYSSIFGGVDHK
jgi:hypothetical protein